MKPDSDKRLWRRFSKRMDELTGAALADLDAAELFAEKEEAETAAFRITLLAAASSDGISLADSETLSEGSDLAVKTEPRDGQILVTLQLQGFAALEDYAGQEGTLKSTNGAIDYRFSFDEAGMAACLLAANPEIREGLKDVTIFLKRNRRGLD